MSVSIRLKRMGTKGKPHFKIVVCDSHEGANSKSIEEIGFYDPSKNPVYVKIDKQRVAHWIGVGAKMTDTIKSIVQKA
ncbi:MAG: 30S ribosomal protein S16 [Candidatus Omnitrophica bacterium]|jgi:small subunit ribosomal protein S16|nr:30S ribosomal protein S16 [Candidatus Omnitrophota bacterium]